jgi:DNA-binding transcriptional LysR family regulator|tara:strand:- start:63 stop:977 length:915 start_codon:yes stop_codon:yes gene_type:complete
MNTHIKDWNQVRTAYHVARLGTVSAAAKFLGMHHATVIRQVTNLEEELGHKLFHRHARGYTPTAAGENLSRIASVNEEQLQGLVGLIQEHGNKVTGELIVTTLPRFDTLVTSWMAMLQKENPSLRIKLIIEDRALKLEYGEAHLAIRAGLKPIEPDNIVKHLLPIQFGMYAHKNYVKEMGTIQSSDDIPRHKYVLNTDIPIMSMHKWIAENIPLDNVIFKSSNHTALEKAVIDGMGIGIFPTFLASESKDLKLVMPIVDEWSSDLWVVTHVDLHRTAKVKACSDLITKQVQSILSKNSNINRKA